MKPSCKLRGANVAHRLLKFFAVTALATVLAAAPSSAKAEDYGFSFSGGGMSGFGVITVSDTPVAGVPGAYQVTGISGTFADTIAGFSGEITGVQTTSLPTGINPDGTFAPPGTDADGFGFSYDNLFFPAGNSPAVCPPPAPGSTEAAYPFGGGLFDIYGLLFDVQGGYTVDLWSNGVVPGFGLTYGVGDALDGIVLDTYGEPFSGTTVDVASTPEPGSLLLLGTGLTGLLFVWNRKMRPSRVAGAEA
jgi:hypothetical protein